MKSTNFTVCLSIILLGCGVPCSYSSDITAPIVSRLPKISLSFQRASKCITSVAQPPLDAIKKIPPPACEYDSVGGIDIHLPVL
jgi:hypothetical protein